MFAAFDATSFDAVKVVILGQDPYHGPGQAHGLCFSVPPGVPDSALAAEHLQGAAARSRARRDPITAACCPGPARACCCSMPCSRVEAGRAGAHQGKGWEGFTDHVVETLGREREGLVFLLWGSYAQAKGRVIDDRRHCVLRAPHPSPLSAHRGFLGCGHFSSANRWLAGRGLATIDWRLPPADALPPPGVTG